LHDFHIEDTLAKELRSSPRPLRNIPPPPRASQTHTSVRAVNTTGRQHDDNLQDDVQTLRSRYMANNPDSHSSEGGRSDRNRDRKKQSTSRAAPSSHRADWFNPRDKPARASPPYSPNRKRSYAPPVKKPPSRNSRRDRSTDSDENNLLHTIQAALQKDKRKRSKRAAPMSRQTSSSESSDRDTNTPMPILSSTFANTVHNFYGNDDFKVARFLKEVDKACDRRNYPNASKLELAHAKLQKPALNQARLLGILDCKKWDTFKRRMSAAFKDGNDLTAVNLELSQCTQKHGESVKTYGYRLYPIAMEKLDCYESLYGKGGHQVIEIDAISQFITGLYNSETANVVRRAEPKLFREAIEIAEKEERGLKCRRSSSKYNDTRVVKMAYNNNQGGPHVNPSPFQQQNVGYANNAHTSSPFLQPNAAPYNTQNNNQQHNNNNYRQPNNSNNNQGQVQYNQNNRGRSPGPPRGGPPGNTPYHINSRPPRSRSQSGNPNNQRRGSRSRSGDASRPQSQDRRPQYRNNSQNRATSAFTPTCTCAQHYSAIGERMLIANVQCHTCLNYGHYARHCEQFHAPSVSVQKPSETSLNQTNEIVPHQVQQIASGPVQPEQVSPSSNLALVPASRDLINHTVTWQHPQ